ncbi:MoaB/Mog domain-containing protein [Sporodiniella umbellata]|nr:MoaB/Mog domain-containing protein [Sporodiniella umbellata]
MEKVSTAACCIIGDEILSGKTQDSNSFYLGNCFSITPFCCGAKVLFSLGIELKCIQVVGDNKEDIMKSVKELSSMYDIVFTSGGIGPTHDDITYEAIANLYDLQLKIDNDAYQYFESYLEKRNLKMTEAHIRMARFPYPALLFRERKATKIPIVIVNKNVYILPGVPALFKFLLDSLQNRLSLMSHTKFYRNEIATKKKETDIAKILSDIQSTEGDIKIGSYPVWKDKDGIRVVLSVLGKDQASVDRVSQKIVEQTNGWLYSSL